MNIIPATAADMARITAAAAADNHPALFPTHFLQDGSGAVRGCFSAGGITTFFFWSHTGNNKFSSLSFAKDALAVAASQGKPVVALCTKDSPFLPHLPGLGLARLGAADIFQLK